MNNKTSTKDLNLNSLEKISPFKPKFFKNLKPSGFDVFTYHAGFKRNNKDLMIIIFDKCVNVQCAYSLTSTPSAPIIWDKLYNKGKCKVLIVNSGNANAHTANKGLLIINKYVSAILKKIKCKKNEVLVSSTGVIGEIFDPNLIINKINKINKSQPADLLGAANTIMTTDTYPKTFIKTVKIKNKKFNIYGFAKGSGMIQPNMGTMLAYIFIECQLSKSQLKILMKKNIEDTFNSISVDSDTSTSDTFMLFSISKNKIDFENKKSFSLLSKALCDVMKNLSHQIIKDGEGLSKLIEVEVLRASNKNQAKKIAFSIVNSPLVKTAIAGEDANWGRVIAAIGKSYEKIDQNKIILSFGKNIVCKNGKVSNRINYKKLGKYLKEKIIKIKVDLGMGNISKTVVGNDLGHQYIRINADYRS